MKINIKINESLKKCSEDWAYWKSGTRVWLGGTHLAPDCEPSHGNDRQQVEHCRPDYRANPYVRLTNEGTCTGINQSKNQLSQINSKPFRKSINQSDFRRVCVE